MAPYANTKYLWLEKDAEKFQKKIEKELIENEKITFNENEFKDLVSPIIKKEILSCLNPFNDKNQILELKLTELKEYIDSHIRNVNKSNPVWIPITISVLSTSLFFVLIILFSYLFK